MDRPFDELAFQPMKCDNGYWYSWLKIFDRNIPWALYFDHVVIVMPINELTKIKIYEQRNCGRTDPNPKEFPFQIPTEHGRYYTIKYFMLPRRMKENSFDSLFS